MKSFIGRYVVKGDELILTRPNQAGITTKVAWRGDELSFFSRQFSSLEEYRRLNR
jgi:hypothetical protein